ncbi:MAG TPA: phasin family protein [Burkholderiales bacterium]|nr:phasin family protein [Burkholderiales bacterium]
MQPQIFEMYRTTLKNAADMMTASLESAQRLQQQQLDALQGAIEEQAKSVRQLSEVRSIDELMALQTRLTGTQMERAMDFWTRLWRAAGDNQMALIGKAQSQFGQAREQLREAGASASSAVSGAMRDAALNQANQANQAAQAAEQARKQQERERRSA